MLVVDGRHGLSGRKGVYSAGLSGCVTDLNFFIELTGDTEHLEARARPRFFC